MKTTLHFDTKIELTFSQLTELAKQLPKEDQLKLAAALVDGDTSMSRKELLARIKEGLEEVEKFKKGKVELPTLEEFLANV